jgi:SulP family sulfate permease
MLSNLVERLRANGVTLAFSGMKRQVLQVMERTELLRKIGSENIYPTDKLALESLRAELDSKAAAS